MAVCLGQAINLGDVEAKVFNTLKDCRRWRGPRCHHLNLVAELAAVGIIGVDDHAQHDRCTTEMADIMVGNGIINRFRVTALLQTIVPASAVTTHVWPQPLQ